MTNVQSKAYEALENYLNNLWDKKIKDEVIPIDEFIKGRNIVNAKKKDGKESIDYSKPNVQHLYEIKYTYMYGAQTAFMYYYALQKLKDINNNNLTGPITILSLGAGNLIDYIGLNLAKEALNLTNLKVNYYAVDYTEWYDLVPKLDNYKCYDGTDINDLEEADDKLDTTCKSISVVDDIHIRRRKEKGDIKKYLDTDEAKRLKPDIVMLPNVLNEMPEDVQTAISSMFTDGNNGNRIISKKNTVFCYSANTTSEKSTSKNESGNKSEKERFDEIVTNPAIRKRYTITPIASHNDIKGRSHQVSRLIAKYLFDQTIIGKDIENVAPYLLPDSIKEYRMWINNIPIQKELDKLESIKLSEYKCNDFDSNHMNRMTTSIRGTQLFFNVDLFELIN